jgi:hypothetical protein
MARKTTRKQLISFGLVFSGLFLSIGMYPLVAGGSPRWWSVVAAATISVIAFCAPDLLARPRAVWLRAGAAVGWFNSRVLLTVIFFVVFIPAGIIMRIFGKDPMMRRLDRSADSYRLRRAARPASHMEHQF